MSPSRIAAITSAWPPSVPCSAAWVDPGERRVAKLGVAGDAGDVEEVVHPDQAVDLVDLVLVDLEQVDQALAQARLEAPGELEPDDLAEAAAADLVLDGLAQVVGLVGDVVVGVAGDPEERVVEDLHAREERLEVVGDDLLERRRRSLPSPIGRNRRRSSFGTLTRASTSVSCSGSRSTTIRLSERFEM